MSDFAFRVTPEELKRKADEFSALIRSMRSRFDRIGDVSGKTRGRRQVPRGLCIL